MIAVRPFMVIPSVNQWYKTYLFCFVLFFFSSHQTGIARKIDCHYYGIVEYPMFRVSQDMKEK
jgi:hypothetical protein